MADIKERDRGLRLVDDAVAQGSTTLTSSAVRQRLGLTPQGTSNLLRRLTDEGILERIRPGSYAIRGFGMLGTHAAAESLPVAVAAAFGSTLHRIGYRSALDELELLTHPARTVQVASERRVRIPSLSGRPLKTVIEPEHAIHIGAVRAGPSWMSGIERALLDAAARPELVGGAPTLVEALGAAAPRVDLELLVDSAAGLGWNAALRRIGSIVDHLNIVPLAGRLHPLKPPTADVDLDRRRTRHSAWRDRDWWVRWDRDPDELRAVLDQ